MATPCNTPIGYGTNGHCIRTGCNLEQAQGLPQPQLERLSARLAWPLVGYLVGRLLVDFGPVVASCPSGRRKLFARQLRGPLS